MIRSCPARTRMRPVCLVAVAVALSACGGLERIDVSRFEEPALTTTTAADALSTAADARACFSTDSTPAVVETRTEQRQETPPRYAPDGTLLQAATYSTVTETRILEDRRDVIVQTVCPEDMTPQFTASLQRALHARGHHRGPITARMDEETRAAVARYQRAQGLHTSILTLAAAKRLGLAIYSESEALNG